MATSTFGKRFAVEQREAARFVKAVNVSVPPTLNKDFKSQYTNLASNEPLREKLGKLLGK